MVAAYELKPFPLYSFRKIYRDDRILQFASRVSIMPITNTAFVLGFIKSALPASYITALGKSLDEDSSLHDQHTSQ